MTDLDIRVRDWMKSLGWEIDPHNEEFRKPDSKGFDDCIGVINAKHLYLNPPLDSPAVLEARADEARICKRLADDGEDSSYRIEVYEQQLKELEDK